MDLIGREFSDGGSTMLGSEDSVSSNVSGGLSWMSGFSSLASLWHLHQPVHLVHLAKPFLLDFNSYPSALVLSKWFTLFYTCKLY